MKYVIERTAQFKKDFKLVEKQGLDIDELKELIGMLANGDTLPDKFILFCRWVCGLSAVP